MFFFDPLYFIILAPGILLSIWASLRTKAAFTKWSRRKAPMTGAEAARRMLDYAGLHRVKIERSKGFLSDHYDPRDETIRLSPKVHDVPSVAAVGVACHEAGHAIQHDQAYGPLKLRTALVPLAGIGSNLSWIVIMIGIFMSAMGLVQLGILLFSATVAFQLVTLPVEFDASKRAKELVVDYGILGVHERVGVERVLNAAAWTYVAAAISSILTLLYFLMRFGLLGGGDD